MLQTRKVVIVGAGHVGSHVALALIQSGEADDIVLKNKGTHAGNPQNNAPQQPPKK